ncbi:DUF6101 family protein [Stappia stellulata]|uniref:DUF6101 family protein n=1 Tax=Stappia stellulata TaxID=71235 RepID=UPI001AD92A7F|nr:DUF6101 family protein [Stappia stellulata]
MSRQTAHQDATAKGSGRAARLDPAQMPHRFASRSVTQAGRSDPTPLDVYIDCQQVIVKRRLAGLPLTLVQPVGVFLGVFAEVAPGATPGTLSARIGLRHRDPAMSIELAASDKLEDLAADWCAWGEALGLPLLLVEPDGKVSRIDKSDEDAVAPMALPRRRVAALTARRPRFLVRRKPGHPAMAGPVYRGEREIIARN